MAETVSFLGIGNMGSEMARRLLAAGYELRVYNRTTSKAQPLVERGAILARTPAEAVEPGGTVLSMLADDAAERDAALGPDGYLQRLSAGGLHIAMSTISPSMATKLASEHARAGCAYVAAPVFGRPEAAAAGKLWVCVAGQRDAKERARPFLEPLGQGIFDFGESPEAANVVKLCGNFLIASAMEAMAEAFTLGEKQGIAREALAELFGRSVFASPIYQNYGRAIAKPEEAPVGFQAALGLKDISLALQTAKEAQVPMPLASLLQGRFLSAVAKGWDAKDWSQAIAFGVSAEAGLSMAL